MPNETREPAYTLSSQCPEKGCDGRLLVIPTKDGSRNFIGCSRFKRKGEGPECGCQFTAKFNDAIQELGREMQELKDEVRYLRTRQRTVA